MIPNFPFSGSCREWINDYQIEIANGKITTNLARRTGLVFVKN